MTRYTRTPDGHVVPTPAIVKMMRHVTDERRGELRRLDLLAHGIEVDLDQAGLIALGQAPDHDDILDKLKIPDRLLAPIWEDWRQSRVLFTVNLPAAVASRGEDAGQAIIARARAEADHVRALLVELARLKVTGEVDELAASLPPYRPGDLDWHEAVDQFLAHLQDPAHKPALGDGQGSQTAPESRTTVTPEISGSGESDSTGAGQARSYGRAQDRSDVRSVKNDQIRDQEDEDWTPI